MEEEKKLESVSQQENVDTDINYIEAIKEMKQNTVSKEAYSKLMEENKQLVSSLINGDTLEQEPSEEKVDVSKLRNELFNSTEELSNLDYVTKALALRNELIKEGKNDPFLPYGEKIIPTDNDIQTADRVAKVLQECVDYANGDSDIFTNELQRVTVDTMPRRR